MINGSHMRVLNPFKLYKAFGSTVNLSFIPGFLVCRYVGDSSVGNYEFRYTEGEILMNARDLI